jgi:hypothetical protein
VFKEGRVARARREPEVFASPFGVEPGGNGDGLQKRRLAGSVLADEEHNWVI